MYIITEYDKRYMPRDKSRHPLAHADYVKLPIKPRGDGLQTLLKHKRGLEVFAVWCLLLEKTTLGKPENRGKLLNHKEEAATPAEIAMGISIERQVKLVSYALSVLIEMGWVKCVGDAGNCGKSAPLSEVKCSEVKCNKDKYREFVFLSKEEYQKLVEKFGEQQTNLWIEQLNNYIGSTKKQYKSHYYTILNWHRRANPPTNKPTEAEQTAIEKRKREAKRNKIRVECTPFLKNKSIEELHRIKRDPAWKPKIWLINEFIQKLKNENQL